MKESTLALILALTGLPFCSQAACSVPETLAGKTFINKTDPAWSPQNPNADSMLRLEFHARDYISHFLKTGGEAKGTYYYRRLSPTVGMIEAQENFAGETTEFTLTLVCLNAVSGTFVFSQEKGAIKPDVRQNTGIYTIQ